MTDDEFQKIINNPPCFGYDKAAGWVADALDAINTLRERLKIAERERDFFRDSGERLKNDIEYWRDKCESRNAVVAHYADQIHYYKQQSEYWQGVATDNAARANDARGQW